MKPVLTCVPCIIKQILYTARAVSSDAWLQKQVVTNTLKNLAEIEYSVLPVIVVNRMFKDALDSLGVTDPFQAQREEVLQNLGSTLDKIQQRASEVDSDRINAAIRMSAAASHFPGMIDFDKTFNRIIQLAKNEPVVFEFERFSREYHKKNKVVLVAAGFIEFCFDIYLLSLLGMNDITCAVSKKPFLWHITSSDISGLGKALPFNAEVNEIVYTNPKQDLCSIINEEDLFICKGFTNFQFFQNCEQMLVHLFYANGWCAPSMAALEMKNRKKSGIVLNFNV